MIPDKVTTHTTKICTPRDPTKSSNVAWVDGYTPVNYANITSSYTAAKFGMLDKNSGAWFFKNSNTYTARGMCSRASELNATVYSVKKSSDAKTLRLIF